MAIEKIAEMFAELGFKVDTKGLKTFEKHLSKLKKDFAGIKSATVKYTAETVKSDEAIKRSSRTKTNSLIADRKRLARSTATTASSIDKMFGIDRKRSPLANDLAGKEAASEKAAIKAAAQATREKAAADKKAARASSQYSQALDGIVRKMNPLQHEYEQLRRHQDMLNKEMTDGTGDAKRYEASLARIQARMKQLDGMRGVNGNLPFREWRGDVGRPSRSGIGVSGGAGLFGAFGAIAAGIGTNRLQVSTEQTQAKMGMVLSPEESAKQIKFASDNARALGTNAVAAAAGYSDLMVQAMRMDIPMKDTQNLFMGVSEASVAMGLSMDQQKGIYKAFSDMLAKGTVNAEELKGQLG